MDTEISAVFICFAIAFALIFCCSVMRACVNGCNSHSVTPSVIHPPPETVIGQQQHSHQLYNAMNSNNSRLVSPTAITLNSNQHYLYSYQNQGHSNVHGIRHQDFVVSPVSPSRGFHRQQEQYVDFLFPTQDQHQPQVFSDGPPSYEEAVRQESSDVILGRDANK